MLVLVKTHGADDKKREIGWSKTSPGVVGFCYGTHIYFLHYYLILSPQYWVGGSLGSRPSPYVHVLIARGWANRSSAKASTTFFSHGKLQLLHNRLQKLDVRWEV